MRILIDLQGAQTDSKHRGIGRYSLALTKAIVQNRGDHEIILALNSLFPTTIESLKAEFIGLLPKENIVVWHAPAHVNYGDPANTWRRNVGELMRESFFNYLNPDIILLTSLFEGHQDDALTSIGRLASSAKTATILYDLIPLLYPKQYLGTPSSITWYSDKIASLKKSDLLLSISNSSTTECQNKLKMDNVVTISSAADPFFEPLSLENKQKELFKAQYNITKNIILYCPGGFDKRKNIDGLMKGYNALPEKLKNEYQLVITGFLASGMKEVLINLARKSGLTKDQLTLTDYISEKELAFLYNITDVYVFPSKYEGFGLSVLEAMRCGAVTIGSNIDSVAEIIGYEEALFDPNQPSSIAQKLQQAIENSDFIKQSKIIAQKRIQNFSWDSSAKKALGALESFITPASSRQNNLSTPMVDVIIEKAPYKNIPVAPTEKDLMSIAQCIDKNLQEIFLLKHNTQKITWRLEGPFDSSYSLALLNRETARALKKLGHNIILHSTEGGGDFAPNPNFLLENGDLDQMYLESKKQQLFEVDIVSRNLYPPRATGMTGSFNMFHHYAWEESGFPQQWAFDFNSHLAGLTCLSEHVLKILIDNGVSTPMLVSGCGVDHWENITPSPPPKIETRKFKFLHVSSCFPRKGVDLLLKAYGCAFTNKDDVSLIIKTFSNPHNDILLQLKEHQAKNSFFPHVVVINTELSDAELKGLYQLCDVLVAPSKAEGFGLPLAEAMLSGLPVITTAWGGQLDFCNEENSWLIDYEFEKAETHFNLFASAWAKINVEQLITVLKTVVNIPKHELIKKAEIGRKKLLEKFKWSDAASKLSSAVFKIKTLGYEPKLNLGWITTWNSKCGIATYSKHLSSRMNGINLTIFAPINETAIESDEPYCVRNWTLGKALNNFTNIDSHIEKNQLNTIIIQFNFGFFNHKELAEFIERQHLSKVNVIMVLHSTAGLNKKNFTLTEIKSALHLCDRILVHTISDLNRLKQIGLINNVALVPLGIISSEKKTARVVNKIPVVASYGFCLPQKGLIELVEAIAILKERGQLVRLKLINAEYPIRESSQLIEKIKKSIHSLKVSDLVEMNNDFLTDAESLNLLDTADLLIFPYRDSNESASSAVRYGMSTGIPVAVTPVEIFKELEGATFKLEGQSSKDIANGIESCLKHISTKSPLALDTAISARNWCLQHDYNTVATRLKGLCNSLLVQKHLNPTL